jgi:WhiB family redox-sensing transcriptional regulator
VRAEYPWSDSANRKPVPSPRRGRGEDVPIPGPVRLLESLMDGRPRWVRKAACRGEDPGLFYSERGDISGYRIARSICSGCAVRRECLDFALGSPSGKFGIWGGLSEAQRRTVRAARRKR